MNNIQKLLSSTLLRESVIYTFFNVINKAIPFLLLPILTSYLGVKGYGLYSVFITLTLFLRHFAGMNLQSVIHRRFFDKERLDFAEYVFNGLLLIVISSVIAYIFTWMFSELIEQVTGIKASLLVWVIVVSMLNNVINIHLNICRAENKPFLYGFMVVFQSALVLFSTIFLLEYSEQGWLATVIGQVLGCVVVCLFSVYYLAKYDYIKVSFNLDYIKDALAYVIPLIPHGISGATFNLSGRLFVSSLEGAEQTGYFTIAYQLASLISLVCTSFSTAWTNWLFGKLKGGRQNYQSMIKATYIYFVLVIIFGLVYALGLPFLAPLFLADEILSHLYYADWIIAGFVLQGFYQVVVGYLFFDNNTKTISKITMLVALISLATNYGFIILYGGKGAAISFFFSWLLMFSLTFFTVIRSSSSPWGSALKGQQQCN